MKAMVLEPYAKDLSLRERPVPLPGDHGVRIRITACGVCRTDLHIVDGDLHPTLPRILGHEIVGVVDQVGSRVARVRVGDRVGVPWLHETCKQCDYCKADKSNLCDHGKFTGFHVDGGFAEYMVAHEDACYAIPAIYNDAEAAPLMCAGLIGFRAYAKVQGAKRIGIYGFGAAAHIITQVALAQGKEIYAFTRATDSAAQAFAKQLGATYAGPSTKASPLPLDAAIIFASVGTLVPIALANVRKGGAVVCAGIHMSDIPSFRYELLWGERSIQSVANLTRADGDEFLSLVAKIRIETQVTSFALENANTAIDKVRCGGIQGAAVLLP